VQISPVTVEFAAQRKVAALRVTNISDTPVAFETAVFRWTQSDGADVLAPTDEIVASPPAFIVAPGRAQILRLGLMRDAAPHAEQAYRLMLTQAPLQQEKKRGGLAMRLQFSLPVFTTPDASPSAPRLEWADEGVRIVNESARRIAIRKLEMESGASGVALAAPRYLLAGQSAVTRAPGAGGVTLSYVGADGEAAEIGLGAGAP
jgi:fimbrial chaperone protein